MKVKIDWPIYMIDAAGEDAETIYEIECELTPEEQETRRTFDDPGHPGAPAECEILTVKLNGVEVKEWERLFNKEALGLIKDAAFEAAPSKEDDDDPRGWEPRNVSSQDDPHDD